MKPLRTEDKAHASFTHHKDRVVFHSKVVMDKHVYLEEAGGRESWRRENGVDARSEDHARRTGSLRPGRLNIQRNLGGFVEAFPDAAVLNSRAF